LKQFLTNPICPFFFIFRILELGIIILLLEEVHKAGYWHNSRIPDEKKSYNPAYKPIYSRLYESNCTAGVPGPTLLSR
jgi:hypothetical protein